MSALHTFGLEAVDLGWNLGRPPATDRVAAGLFANARDLSLGLGRTDDGVVCRGREASWAYTGFGVLNRVWTAGEVDPGRAAARVADVLACFVRWSASFCWVTDQQNGATGWDVALRDAGFRGPVTLAGLAVELSKLGGPTVGPASAGNVAVRRVTTAADLAAWVRVNEDGQTGESLAAAADLFAPYHLGGDRRCAFYASYAAGGSTPVARVMTFTKGKTAGLYWLSARPDCRGRGYEPALVNRALADARRGGAEFAVTLARTTDEPAWAEMGFTRRSTLKSYEWAAPMK